MEFYRPTSEPVLERPVMLLALSGWVDAASVATGAAEFVARDGVEVGAFDPDALFDYRSSRPVLRFSAGDLEDISWPKLRVVHADPGRDVLVVHGNEPDYRWQQLSAEFVELMRQFDVALLVTLGAVPAMVPHTRAQIEVVCTTSDASLLLDDDVMLQEDLVVPGAAVSILRRAAFDAGIPTIGYWARVPHYLNQQYHAGTLALLDKVARQAEVNFDVADLKATAVAQRADLDRIAGARVEIKEYITRLEGEESAGDDLPSADELAAEVERYLRDASEGD